LNKEFLTAMWKESPVTGQLDGGSMSKNPP